MPAPTPVKTWQSNQQSPGAAGSLLLQNRDTLYRIKNALTTFGTLPWVVQRSSNSVTANTSDNWASAADLIWANAGTIHSWIVLKQTGIASNFQMCIDLAPADANGSTISIIISPSSGFTGGTTSNRPTATDEGILFTSQTFSYGTAAATQQISCFQSTDGQCTRVMIWKGSVSPAIWVLDKSQGIPASLSSWVAPFVCMIKGTSGGDSDAALYNQFATSSSNVRVLAPDGTVASCFLASEGGTQAVGQTQTVANEASSNWPLCPPVVVSETNQTRGRWGYLVDLFTSSTTLVSGDPFPASGNKTWIESGDLVFPWDNSTLPIGGSTARDGELISGVSDITQLGMLPYTVVPEAFRVLGPGGANPPRNQVI